MALILNIDTSLDEASVSLAKDEDLLASLANPKTSDHAVWIHGAVRKILMDHKVDMRELNAVGICLGPGSYTGLRIGLSTAKGLCYALRIPLLTAGTLEVLALSAISSVRASKDLPDSGELMSGGKGDLLFCPMIDARRMEVFTAVYDLDLGEKMEPHALILNNRSFEGLLERHRILFFGSGSMKFEQICQNRRAFFKNVRLSPVALAKLIYRNFIGNNFAGLAYTEPLYLKEFFTSKPRTAGD